MRKIVYELRKAFPFAEIETARRAYRLRLPGGRSVFTWATPSDRRAMRNTKAQVRRVLKTPPLR